MPSKFEAQDIETLQPTAVVKDVTYVGVNFLWGFSIDETGSAAVELVFRDGGSTGDIVAWVNVAADASANMSYIKPLHFPGGLHIVAVTGAFTMRAYQ